MPITDNNFTAEELASAVNANPELLSAIKTFGQTTGGFFRTKEEQAEYEKNYEASIVSKKTSEFANGIEKDILETFGEPKLENEKYHEYLKRVGTTTKGRIDTMKTELEALKAGSSGSEMDKARIKQLEKAISDEKAELNNKLTEKEFEIHSLKAGYAIEKAMSPLRSKYAPNLPQSVIDIVESNVIKDVTSKLKNVDGQLMVIGEDGNPVLDKTTFKPKSISQVLEDAMADILDKGKQASGAGTGGGKAPVGGIARGENGEVTEVTHVPAEVKTKVELTGHLLKLGLLSDSAVFKSAFEKFGKDLPLR